MKSDARTMLNHFDEGKQPDPAGIGHAPVLLTKVVELLNLGPGARVIDGTVGGGGHTGAILAATAPDGRMLALDADPSAIERVAHRFAQDVSSGRLKLREANFVDMQSISQAEHFSPVDAILLDLGVSSYQLDTAERGFSFQQDGPLDMRMSPHQNLSADVIINGWPEKDIADILYRYGDEHRSRRIARAILARRPIHRTTELADIVAQAVGGRRGQRIHPATQTFQALRIAVNQELDALEDVLPQCLALLRPGGRMAVISFHSLEDRIVKLWMQGAAADYIADPTHPMGGVSKTPEIRILTRKPVIASERERVLNPRSRSAKLRVAETVIREGMDL